MSIKIKLLIMFLSVSMIPLFFISILTFNNYKKSIETQRILELKDLAEIKAERIDSYFNNLNRNIKIAQTLYNIKTNLPILSKHSNDMMNPESAGAKNMLDGQLQEMQVVLGLTDIILITPQGKIVYLSDAKNFSNDLSEILPVSEQINLREDKNRIFYSEIFTNKAKDNKLSMLIAVPAYGFNDSFIGFIAHTFEMTEIYNIIQDETGLGNTGEVLIVKKINDKIVFLNPLRHDPKAALNRTVKLGDPLAQPAQEGSQGKSGTGELTDYRDVKVIAAWNYIPRIKWGMVAKIDVKEAFMEAENLRNLVLMIFLIILALSSVMAFSISQSISEPINQLTKGAEIIGRGNLDYKVEIGSNDEIGRLSRTFDKMTSDLKIVTASRDELNIEITERKKAEEALRQQSMQLQENNSLLEEQQQQLQMQSEELQQSNLELEERQQELQQQSEELQQTNSLLEEQQQQLEMQAGELNIKNQNLVKSKYEVEMANQYKSEFLANMSHELRTPLNSIILLSKIMARNEKNNFSEEDIKKLNIVYQSGNELLRLINDILDLSKIESGKIDLNINSFYSSELLDDLKNMFAPAAKEKNLDFTLEDNLKETVKTDKDKLSQIIRNFLSNAIKFTKLGFVKLSFDNNAGNEYSYSVNVQDSGEGIPSDKQEMIFEAFHQVDGSISRQFGGTGLGLSIARELASLISGKIILKSEPGKGSAFTLLFNDLDHEKIISYKRQKQAKETDAVIEEANVIDDRNNIKPEEIVVLVIDDDKKFAGSLMEILHKNNYKVLIALNGKEGIALIKKYIPRAILLDLILPDIDGFEILREIKSTRELNDIPVMIISGRKKDNKYFLTGAFDYIEKPVDIDKLETSLQKMLLKSKENSFQYQKKNNVLLVEDNAVLRNAIKALLENESIKILESESEEDALDKIKNNDFGLAIVDLGLKKGNGLEICKYIKENKLSIPVLIYTGKAISKQQEKNLKKYSESIILKTVNSDERLLEEVNYFLFKPGASGSQDNENQIKFKSLDKNLNLKNKTILIADDDIKNVFVMTSALENFNVKILDAQNGKEALSILKKEKVDLVLMDIMMPVMDGYQAMREIRNTDEIKNIPIIALTAKALSGDRKKCLEAGADDYISKPIDYDGMINIINAWIDKKK